MTAESCLLTRGGDVVLAGAAAQARPEAVVRLLDDLLASCSNPGRFAGAVADGTALDMIEELSHDTTAKRRRVEVASVALRGLAAEADAARAMADAAEQRPSADFDDFIAAPTPAASPTDFAAAVARRPAIPPRSAHERPIGTRSTSPRIAASRALLETRRPRRVGAKRRPVVHEAVARTRRPRPTPREARPPRHGRAAPVAAADAALAALRPRPPPDDGEARRRRDGRPCPRHGRGRRPPMAEADAARAMASAAARTWPRPPARTMPRPTPPAPAMPTLARWPRPPCSETDAVADRAMAEAGARCDAPAALPYCGRGRRRPRDGRGRRPQHGRAAARTMAEADAARAMAEPTPRDGRGRRRTMAEADAARAMCRCSHHGQARRPDGEAAAARDGRDRARHGRAAARWRGRPPPARSTPRDGRRARTPRPTPPARWPTPPSSTHRRTSTM